MGSADPSDVVRALALRLVKHSDLTVDEVARLVGVEPEVVHSWRATASPSSGPRDAAERRELERLRRENADLLVDREVLRRTIAYLAEPDAGSQANPPV